MFYHSQRVPLYTTIRELGPIIPSIVWYSGPNSLIVVYMDPLGLYNLATSGLPRRTGHEGFGRGLSGWDAAIPGEPSLSLGFRV